MKDELKNVTSSVKGLYDEAGRVGYLVLYLMGAPVGLLLLLWVVLGDNIFGRG